MRVLIADDHDLLRDTLVAFLEANGETQTNSAANLADAVSILKQEPPFDLVLLDLNMPGMNGLNGLNETLEKFPDQRIAIISGIATREVAEAALSSGAAGFIPKTLPAKSLVNAINFMAMGEQYVPINFMTTEEAQPPNPLAEKLTNRENQVLQGLTEGKSNKQIARDLDLTEPTIKLHVKTLYRKLGVANRTQAAIMAREAGLF
ncbi:MAG: response regulator transcription factor [Rhodobacteraceae bacterium]|nr:response regulator transcription factor [Paracoccaceae bacterium]